MARDRAIVLRSGEGRSVTLGQGRQRRFIRELAELSAAGRANPAAMAELGARHDDHFDLEVLEDRYSG